MRGRKSTQKEDAAMAVESKENAKADDTKATKTTSVKETEEKTKEPAKKAGAGKTTKKTTAKTELKPEIFIQFQGKESILDDALEQAKRDYIAAGHRVSSIKSMQVYLKPEECAAYYVINQKFAGKVDLF